MTQTAKNVTSTAVASGAAVASGGAGVAGNMAQAAAGGYAQGGDGIAGLARAGASAMNTGVGMMMTAAGRGMSETMGKSAVGRAVSAGKEGVRRYFGMGENKQAPTVTGFAASAQQGMKAGAQNIRQEITTGAHAVASVAKDVARDISKESLINSG